MAEEAMGEMAQAGQDRTLIRLAFHCARSNDASSVYCVTSLQLMPCVHPPETVLQLDCYCWRSILTQSCFIISISDPESTPAERSYWTGHVTLHWAMSDPRSKPHL